MVRFTSGRVEQPWMPEIEKALPSAPPGARSASQNPDFCVGHGRLHCMCGDAKAVSIRLAVYGLSVALSIRIPGARKREL